MTLLPNKIKILNFRSTACALPINQLKQTLNAWLSSCSGDASCAVAIGLHISAKPYLTLNWFAEHAVRSPLFVKQENCWTMIWTLHRASILCFFFYFRNDMPQLRSLDKIFLLICAKLESNSKAWLHTVNSSHCGSYRHLPAFTKI